MVRGGRDGRRLTSFAELFEEAAAYDRGFTPVEAALEGFEAIAGAGGLDHPYSARETPCTLLIDEVEAIWAAIAEGDDWSPLAAKLAEIREMAEDYGTEATAA